MENSRLLQTEGNKQQQEFNRNHSESPVLIQQLLSVSSGTVYPQIR